jgi:hypothetical protein
VLSVPIGDIGGSPKLQLIGIPESAVDWSRTDAYTTAVRAHRYAETRGEEDYAILSGHVTLALNDITTEPNPVRRLAMAEEARRNLAAWPAANYNYRAEDVARMVALFDDAISEMKAAAGQRGFNLALVATTLPPPPMALMQAPDTRATLEMAFSAASVTTDASERASLLRTLSEDLQYAPAAVPWAHELRTRVNAALAVEVRTDRAYSTLTASSMKAAAAAAARTDVGSLKNIIARALRTDESLGRTRPAEMAALLAALDARLDEARRVRLARDAWLLRVEALKEYRKAIESPLDRLGSFRKWLEAIRDLSGPDPRFLRPLEDRAALGHLELGRVTPPAEAQAAHGLVSAALHMTKQAAALRRNAILSNDIKMAWDGSAAAAGALTLAQRALDELDRLISSRPR